MKCERCGADFTPNRYWQKFCTRHCTSLAQKERYAKMRQLLEEDEKRQAATLEELAE